MKRKFRFVYLDIYGYDDVPIISVAEIIGDRFAVIGNGDSFKIKKLKKDWGAKSKWGKWIKYE